MKKYYIKDLNENQVIHTPTQEIAEKLCKKLDELGFKWYLGKSYLENYKWEEYKEDSCYRPATGNFGSKYWYKINYYEVLTIDRLLDFEEPLKIEVGKFYKTRDGRKARIYSTKNGGEYPIHGAVESNGIGEVQSWKEGGKYHEGASQSNLDIVSGWEDEHGNAEVSGYARVYGYAQESSTPWFAVSGSLSDCLSDENYQKTTQVVGRILITKLQMGN